ncbi:MAG: ABC transporter substrate-binding protein [Alphaproteobacteria bacterium]|nr:ABC transporter substrate-binding protein [Alphaproteobacteria bacterium]
MTMKELERLYAANKISRRDFLAGAAAVGALGAAGTLGAPSARAATPKKGGHMRVGLGTGSTSDVLDPATFDTTFNQVLGYGTLRSSLTEVTPEGDIGPEIAESWEASPDAKTWVFKLRQGVEFHDGKSMTVDDVIASLNHHRGEETQSAAKPLLASVEEIRADGPDTLVVQLAAGNADFPYYMTDYHLAILPSDGEGKVDATSGNGTGPYKLESFEPGVSAMTSRFENYFKGGDRQHFDSFEMLALTDTAARTNAMTTGEVDYMERADLKTVHLLERRPGVAVLKTDGTQHYTMPMITTQDPYTDNNVRLALKHAINREDLLEKVLRGYGAVGNDHPIGTANRYHADIEQRTYDPDKARFYAKQAGMENLAVNLSAADAAFAGAVDAAVLFREHAAAAGIDVTVVREPNDGYWSDVWMVKPFSMCYWGGRPTEDQMFTTAYADGVPWNDTFWSHERFNSLLVEARAVLDEAKRAEMYYEMQQIVRDEGGVIVPLFASYVDAHTDKLAHGAVGSNYALDGFKLAERWWWA